MPRACLQQLLLACCCPPTLLPHTAARSAQVDLVLMPATTGDFGVMPGHVPTVAQLRCAV